MLTGLLSHGSVWLPSGARGGGGGEGEERGGGDQDMGVHSTCYVLINKGKGYHPIYTSLIEL